MNFKKISKLFLNPTFIQKIIAYSLLIFMFYLFSDFLFIFFLTFIFAYLFLNLGSFLKKGFDSLLGKICKNKNRFNFFKRVISLNLIIVLQYLVFIGILVFTVSDLLPKITKELSEIPKHVPILADQVNSLNSKLEEIKNFNSELGGSITEVFSSYDYGVLLNILDRLKTAGVVFLQVFLALILSYIFIADRHKLGKFLMGMKDSNFGFFYHEYRIIFEKITRSFGLIFKAQSMIAFANALLTSLGLIIIGFLYNGFPFIHTLAIIVFICGFIPVFGVFIGSIPILIIAFTMVGGLSAAVSVVVLILVIHAIEAYYLNPKIVSSFMELPVSLTFIVLLVSEHFLGVAGLVIGISSFYLLLDLMKDADMIISKSRKVLKAKDNVVAETKKGLKKGVRVSRKVEE